MSALRLPPGALALWAGRRRRPQAAAPEPFALAVGLRVCEQDLFSLYVRTVRARAQATQAELAAAVGVSPDTVARWERGDREAAGVTRARLAVYAAQHNLPEPPKRPLRRDPLAPRPSERAPEPSSEDES
jgi:DNA-binding XRE family transcriptional regulator